MMADEQIHAILRHDKPVKRLCEMLIKLANDSGGHDNITALVIQHIEQPETTPDPTLEELAMLEKTGEYSYIFKKPLSDQGVNSD